MQLTTIFAAAGLGLALAVAQPRGPRPLDLEDKPAMLKPARPRNDSDQDRIEALSMFSAARMLEKQQDYPAPCGCTSGRSASIPIR